MPCTTKRVAAKTVGKRKAARQRDESRFNCPYPGCDRSCAELWRLKVHFRAPPDSKGSGVERGHNAELENCPRCLQKLETGKHHIGCRSGLAAPRQALKREERNQEAKLREKAVSARASSVPDEDRPVQESEAKAAGKQEPGFASGSLPGTEYCDSKQANLGIYSSVYSFASLGGAIQLQQAYSSLPDTPQAKFHMPAVSLAKDMRILSPSTGVPLADCEVDDEVVIPRSFAPLLTSGGGRQSLAFSPGTGATLAAPTLLPLTSPGSPATTRSYLVSNGALSPLLRWSPYKRPSPCEVHSAGTKSPNETASFNGQ